MLKLVSKMAVSSAKESLPHNNFLGFQANDQSHKPNLQRGLQDQQTIRKLRPCAIQKIHACETQSSLREALLFWSQNGLRSQLITCKFYGGACPQTPLQLLHAYACTSNLDQFKSDDYGPEAIRLFPGLLSTSMPKRSAHMSWQLPSGYCRVVLPLPC